LHVLRKILDMSIPLLGIVVIMGAVLCLRQVHAQIGVVLIGILVIELGVWKIAQEFLLNQRCCHTLRGELDRFIGLVRQLNDAALAVKTHETEHHRQVFDETHEAMKQAVERMVQVAGKTNEEIAAEDKPTLERTAVDVEH
jgi:hypothetical protein